MLHRPGRSVSFAVAVALLANSHLASGAEAVPRPNILWLTCEDTGPQLGCFGYANQLAKTILSGTAEEATTKSAKKSMSKAPN